MDLGSITIISIITDCSISVSSSPAKDLCRTRVDPQAVPHTTRLAAYPSNSSCLLGATGPVHRLPLLLHWDQTWNWWLVQACSAAAFESLATCLLFGGAGECPRQSHLPSASTCVICTCHATILPVADKERLDCFRCGLAVLKAGCSLWQPFKAHTCRNLQFGSVQSPLGPVVRL